MKLHNLGVRQSGRWGGMVYVNSKHGQLARALPQQPRLVTPPRLRAQGNCANIAALWRTLSDDQMAGWRALARQESLRLGQPVSGYHLFTGLNTTRLAAPAAPARWPPPCHSIDTLEVQAQYKDLSGSFHRPFKLL